MKILKFEPELGISLEEMLQHPLFTKYYPQAYKSLIKPDENIQYKPFIVSKVNPKIWDPLTGNNGSQSIKSKPIEVTPKIFTTKKPTRARSGEKQRIKRENSPVALSSAGPKTNLNTEDKYNMLATKYEQLKKDT